MTDGNMLVRFLQQDYWTIDRLCTQFEQEGTMDVKFIESDTTVLVGQDGVISRKTTEVPTGSLGNFIDEEYIVHVRWWRHDAQPHTQSAELLARGRVLDALVQLMDNPPMNKIDYHTHTL